MAQLITYSVRHTTIEPVLSIYRLVQTSVLNAKKCQYFICETNPYTKFGANPSMEGAICDILTFYSFYLNFSSNSPEDQAGPIYKENFLKSYDPLSLALNL